MACAAIAAVSRISSIRRSDRLAEARGDTGPKASRRRRVPFTRLERASLAGMLVTLMGVQAMVMTTLLASARIVYPRHGWRAYAPIAVSGVVFAVTGVALWFVVKWRLPGVLAKPFPPSRDGDT